MARISLADPTRLTPNQQEQYDRFPSNLTRALLLLDDRLATALPATANALRASGLDPALREAVILRVAAAQGSAYERFQHLGQARDAGWTDEDIHQIESAPPRHGLSAETDIVLRLVDSVIAGPTVPQDVFDAARTALGDRDLVTVVVLVGHYLTVARVIGVLDIELDVTPDDWTREH